MWRELYKKSRNRALFITAKQLKLLDSYQHLAKAKIEPDAGISILASLLMTLPHQRANGYKHMSPMTIRLS